MIARKMAMLVAVSLLLGGCVTGTRSIDLVTPEIANDQTASGQVFIRSIEDKRVFEAKPPVASTPSVKGDLNATTPEKLATLIGRQRNGYGKAMGDVALPEGGTVLGEVKKLLTKGLESRGYTVSDDASAPIHLDIDIIKFWAWFRPGMWVVSFDSAVECKLDFSGAQGDKQFQVSGNGVNKGQVASDANWILTYERAYTDFLTNLDAALDEAGW